MEDGVERANVIEGNLVAVTRASSALLLRRASEDSLPLHSKRSIRSAGERPRGREALGEDETQRAGSAVKRALSLRLSRSR